MAEFFDKTAQYLGLKAPAAGEEESDGDWGKGNGEVTDLASYSGSGSSASSQKSERTIVTMMLKKYDERMRQVATKFRAGVPLILNVQQASKDDCTRIGDFVSGLTLGLNGELQEVGDGILLLTPANVKRQDVDGGMPNLFES